MVDSVRFVARDRAGTAVGNPGGTSSAIETAVFRPDRSIGEPGVVGRVRFVRSPVELRSRTAGLPDLEVPAPASCEEFA